MYEMEKFVKFLASNFAYVKRRRYRRAVMPVTLTPYSEATSNICKLVIQHMVVGCTFFYRQLGYLAFSLRFWAEIKQLLIIKQLKIIVYSILPLASDFLKGFPEISME